MRVDGTCVDTRSFIRATMRGKGINTDTKLLYGVGDIAVTIHMVLFSLFILFFYNSVLGLPATLVGIASAIGLLWDAFVDPYLGYRSDNSTSRLGRRHLYMVVGALTMGPSFYLLLNPSRDLSKAGLFAWLLVATLLFRTTSAVFRIPYLSLGAELSQDYHERTEIVGIRSFFGLLGMLGAATLSFYLFFPNTTPGADPKLDYSGYPRMGLAFGIVMMVTSLLAVMGTLSHRSIPGPVGEKRSGSARDFLRGFALALRNRAFRKVWLSFSTFFLAIVLNGVVSIHFFTWYVKIVDSRALGRIQSLFYVGSLVGVLFWIRLARSAEKRVLYIVAVSGTAGLTAAAALLFGEGALFGTGDPNPLYAGYAVAGFFASAVWVLPASMLADVADEDELETGLRREGIFFGILNFGEKIAAGFAALVAGALLDYFVLLAPGETQQSPGTVHRIGLVYGALPAVVLAAAAFIVAGYGLDRKRVSVIQNELERRREPVLTSPDNRVIE